jgi:hypothetical protein
MELVINIPMADCMILKFIPDFLGGLHKHIIQGLYMKTHFSSV